MTIKKSKIVAVLAFIHRSDAADTGRDAKDFEIEKAARVYLAWTMSNHAATQAAARERQAACLREVCAEDATTVNYAFNELEEESAQTVDLRPKKKREKFLQNAFLDAWEEILDVVVDDSAFNAAVQR